MRNIDTLLDEAYASHERITRDGIYRRALAASLPANVLAVLDALPDGEYAQDEIREAIAAVEAVLVGLEWEREQGVPANQLSDTDLRREMSQLHRTREDAFRRAPDRALTHHLVRTDELEQEYLRRFPDREVDPRRLRPGARAGSG